MGSGGLRPCRPDASTSTSRGDYDMTEKSPQKPTAKKAGKTLLEKRAIKREKKTKGSSTTL